jgi:hypothetical protein
MVYSEAKAARCSIIYATLDRMIDQWVQPTGAGRGVGLGQIMRDRRFRSRNRRCLSFFFSKGG